MSKVTRNGPCPCGSGKKYKHCCINEEIPELDDNDLFMVSSYGSEAYSKDELDKYGRFFIETQADKKFEIRKAEQGYLVKDIVPPEITMPVNSYRTVKLNDIQRQKLIKHNPQYDFLTIGSHDYFDGIAEDGHFTWDGADGSTSSKGKISRLYIKQALGNYLLNVNLFPEKGEFKSIDEFLLTGLSIYTETNKYDFPCREGKLFFEDSQVFAILSAVDKESFNINEMFSTVPREYNVSFDIVIGKPIFILKVHEQGLKLSIINEKVIDVTILKN